MHAHVRLVEFEGADIAESMEILEESTLRWVTRAWACPGDKSKIGNNLAGLSDKLDVRDR